MGLSAGGGGSARGIARRMVEGGRREVGSV